MFEKIVRSTDNPYGFVLYRGGEGRPGIIWLHGKGGRGDGSDTALQGNLDNGNIPQVLQQGVQDYKMWLFAPQMSTDWTNAETMAMFAYIAQNNLPVELLQMNYAGFSMGGGGILRFLNASLANARKFACAIIIAPTGVTPNKYIAEAKVACWFHHNIGDDQCPVSNTNNAVTAINSFNPPIAAVKTIYNVNAHGGEQQAMGLTPPSAPGGQGLTKAQVTAYQWFGMNRQGSPVAVPQITGLVANAGPDKTVKDPKVHLDGTGSANYVTEKSSWQIVKDEHVPPGVNRWEVIKSGGGWIEADALLTAPGNYIFTLTVRDSAGNAQSDTVTITYAPNGSTEPPPTVTKEMKAVTIDMVNKSVAIGFNDNSKITIHNDGTQS